MQTPWEVQLQTFVNTLQYIVGKTEKDSNTHYICGNFETVADGCFPPNSVIVNEAFIITYSGV